MATIVLGAAGALVGSFFGPLGTSIGWSIGAALGGALFPGKGQTGPRLTDLKLHTSSYGQMIPITFGTVRMAGCVIWQTDLQEHEEHSGGKGGAPETTNFTYSASFAVQLCEGPIGGVLRIWADSRLVWDPSVMDPTDFPFTLYTGTETQLPDPTIESVEGVGNVPGHRGNAYVVFTDMTLTDYGNRLPSLTFEVFNAGGPIPWRYSSFTPFNNESRAGFAGEGPQSGAIEDGNLVLSLITHTGFGANSNIPAPFEIRTYDLQGNLISTDLTTTMAAPSQGGGISTMLTGTCTNNPHITWARGSPVNPGDYITNAFYYDGALTCEPIYDPTGSTSGAAVAFALNSLPVYHNDAVYGTGGNGVAFISKWSAPSGVVSNGSSVAHYYLPGAFSGSAWTTAVADNGDVWCAAERTGVPSAIQLLHFDSDLNVIDSFTESVVPATLKTSFSFTVWNGYLFTSDPLDSFSGHAYTIDPGGTFTLTDPGSLLMNPGNSISLGNGLVLVDDGIVSLQPQSQPVTLASIVSALSVRAGLGTNQIDVTELTDLVDGYVISNQSDVRALIEPLQIAWPFDAVEHDVIVKFHRRGVGEVDTEIPLIDLGAYEWPGESVPVLRTTRDQEVDLPRIVDVTFINKNTDYQNGEQRGQRLITNSQLTTSIQLAIVMDDQKGKEIADSRLYEAWIEREKFQIELSRKWLLLEPSDVILADERVMRITKATQGSNGVMKFDTAATSLLLYNQIAPAPEGVGMPGSGGVPPTAPPVLQDTDLILLDLPLIRDTDNSVGFYAAMAGALQPSWVGATLFKSIDGGTTWNSELLDTVSETFGDCSTILGDFTGGNVFDEVNSLTVVLSLGAGTLSSSNRLGVLNGANTAAVGTPGTTGIRNMEIIQFRDAQLIGTRTYKLTGLRRGRRGSEWMIPLHASGEKFILLPATNVLGDPAELYLDRKYRAVTSGRALSTGAVMDFTNYGIAVLPYAPCKLGGGRESNNDVILNWVRRTRIGGGWRDFTDVPLSEATELYQIRIYGESGYTTVKRVVTSSTQTYTYSAVDQTTDFGTPQSVVYWGVSQLGTFAWGTEAKAST